MENKVLNFSIQDGFFRPSAKAGKLFHALTIFFCLAAAAPADSQPAGTAPAPTYADLADLALTAPVTAHVRVKEAIRLGGERALGVPPGKTRFYIVAEVASLIRAPQSVPAEIAYLADMPNDAKDRPVRLRRKTEFIVVGQPVRGRAGEFQLVAPDAQLPYSEPLAARLRAILAEGARADAAPAITGIGRAFHVPGSLPGESETQIFLQAADGRPISLSILRRPGEAPNWGVALTEIAANTAEPPRPDTLLWYRLACTLPRTLPPLSLSDATPDQADAIRADYRLVLESLGPCARTRRG